MSSPSPTPVPPEGPKLANGDPLPADLDLFAPPPPEIGEPFAATSTLKIGMKPTSPVAQNLFTGGIQLACTVLAIGSAFKNHGIAWYVMVPAGIIGLAVGTAIAMFVAKEMGFIASVYYLSELGAARIRCKSSRTQIDLRQTMLFADAVDMFMGFTHVQHEGMDVWYQWTDAKGTMLLLIEGKHRQENRAFPLDHPIHLAERAVKMWLDRHRPRLLAQFASQGHLDFRVADMGHIRLAKGAIEFHFKGRDLRIRANEIVDFRLANGVFTLRFDSPDQPGSRAPIMFAHANIANVPVFFELVDSALDWPLTEDNRMKRT